VRTLLLVVAVAAGLAAGSAGAAPSRDTLIRPGQGIGKVSIGMTEAQVRARLGRPGAMRTRRVGFGSTFVELQYDDGYFWVGLLGRPGRMRVHSVGTIQEFQRTPQGFGVGTRETRLAREYGARMRCDRLWINDNFSPAFVGNRWRDCVVNRGSGAETVFVTALPRHVRRVFVEPGDWRGLASVIEVRVRRGALPS
jgi:hypothetical protein